ncbi:MAG: hypothetical protein PVJ04_12455 [Gemmatimonadota bacterium]
MSLISATLRLDVRIQARSRLYAIGIAVALVLGLVARYFFDDDHAGRVLASLYLLGVGGTTYIFGASLLLLEKSQGTLQALRATPLTSNAYLGSKAVTLTMFALVESVIIYVIGFPGADVSFWTLVLGVGSLGVAYTLVGMGQVAAHDSVTSFLMPGALIVGGILQLPFLYVLGVGPDGLWYAIPTQGPLLVMLGAFEPMEPWKWMYALGMSAAFVGVSAWWARHRLSRFVGLQDE